MIAGSGASGSLLAAKLAQAGKRVRILEAGPERRLGALYSSQIWARRLKWAGPYTESGGKHRIEVHFNSGWGTGGAALHHYACWLRLHPEDFEMKTRFGRGLDWPLSYDDLRPFYDEVQKEVGIAGNARAEVWRPAGEPYPMPPHKLFAQGRVLARGFEKLGLRTAPLPLAINSVPYGGRPACRYEGWCDSGCPIYALANPLAIYLPQARRAGAQLAHACCVARVLVNEKGDRATGVEYFDAAGERRVQPAEVVILAAFAVQNPRILLNSASAKHPAGLANSSGTLGRYLMTHTNGRVAGLFREPTENWMGATGGQLLSQENYAKDPKKGYLSSSQWLIAQALKPNDLTGFANERPELFGRALDDFLKTAAQHLAGMVFCGENLPAPENRLTLSDKKDRFGMPLARMAHEFSADDLKGFEAGKQQGEAVLRAAGAYQVWTAGPHTMHILGGTIMGRDPKASVTNSYGQTHDITNLFVAGPGLFPTSAGVNPTFTISALALRTARYIAAQWSALT